MTSRRRGWRWRNFPACSALLVLGMASCGGDGPASDRDEIESVVKRSVIALGEGDFKTYCSLLTGKALGQFGVGEFDGESTRADCERRWRKVPPAPKKERRALAKTRITSVDIDGDRASARFRVYPGVTLPYNLRRVQGAWLISDIDPTGVGAEVEAGFERAERSRQTAANLDCETFRFDAQAWRRAEYDATAKPPTRRQRQADAVIKCRRLIGLDRRAIRALLGRPNNYVARGNELSWTTGPERNYFSIDDEHLVAQFNANQRVRRVLLTTD